MQDAVASGKRESVEALFNDKADSKYFFEMADRSGKINAQQVAVFEAPTGWESEGKYWAMFHN